MIHFLIEDKVLTTDKGGRVMKTKAGVLGVLALFITILIFGVSNIVYAQVVQEFSTDNGIGKADWENGYVYGTAIGTANMSEMVNEIQAEQVAKTTARHLAYMVLSEIINKVSIDASSIYRKQLMVDSILKIETKGILENAHVWKDEFSWTPKGSPKAVVTVRIPIHGGLSRVVAGWAERQQKIVPPLPKFEATTKTMEEEFTGLIIDAGGKGVKPVMVPRILTSDGTREVYGPRAVNKNIAIINGFAGYARSVDMAKKNDRVGSNPLIVKAQRAEGTRSGDIVVSEDNAKKILTADIDGRFLKDCKVLIVVN